MYNLLSPQSHLESPVKSGTFFPSITSKSFHNTRTHIPIRSISYKKNPSMLQEFETRKNVGDVKGQYAISPGYVTVCKYSFIHYGSNYFSI